MTRQDIKFFTLKELKDEIFKMQESPYRATQIFYWIYKKGVTDFERMSNIPKPLKEKLKKRYYISRLKLFEQLESSDGTKKFLFELRDGNFIEAVLIYDRNRKTLCLSTQVGCRFRCLFCASGLDGFVRNLEVSEIINQVLFLRYELGKDITNYVFMGMGEPLDNYDNLSRAILIMNNPNGLGIAARRFVISTCGIIPGIEKLKNLRLHVNLSLSLHGANNKLRSELLPINRRYPLERLIKVLKDYINETGNLITLEYLLIKDKNDSLDDASSLAKIAKTLKAKVNLIPCSEVEDIGLKATDKTKIFLFAERLKKNGVRVTVRRSKGSDIDAACGQLAGRIKK